ncbi:MAG TPA: S8 family peptidase [Longimicrobiaceae bacterium]|nr:S8 family peptidase [Longimicrobiaceae bacterium]
MKHLPLAAVVLLAAGACAPAPPPAAPAPAPAAPPVQAPGAPAESTAIAAGPAANWWLLDPQSDGVPGIGAERAYRELLAGRTPKRSVTIAIIDSGVDIDHPDLRPNIWTNAREVAGNGKDDDRNGYPDDVHGWDFLGNRDGRDIEYDTYEVTRLYAALRRYEGANPDTLGAARHAEYERFRALKAEWEQERAKAAEQLQQVLMIDAALPRVEAVLHAQVGGDSLTVQRVSAISSPHPQVQQAREIWLELAALEITPRVLEENRKALETRLKYGFDPDFNPRPIIGDNYNDPKDRFYGNADVRGPDPSHGTHVAGIAAAKRGNGIGIDGVAPADSVRILVVRAVPDGDERDKDVANAIRYAADNGADVINMSFGKGHSPQKQWVDDAVRHAEQKGVLLVHAAGNDGENLNQEPSFPTRYYEGGGEAKLWITVGASTPSQSPDSLAAPFSNWGKGRVDVFAPGVAIYSTTPDNGYERNQGTSMAAPVVTGLAALLMAYYPELSAAEVKQIILESVTPHADQLVVRPGSETGERVPFSELATTGGVVNAYRAVQLAEQRVGRATTSTP